MSNYFVFAGVTVLVACSLFFVVFGSFENRANNADSRTREIKPMNSHTTEKTKTERRGVEKNNLSLNVSLDRNKNLSVFKSRFHEICNGDSKLEDKLVRLSQLVLDMSLAGFSKEALSLVNDQFGKGSARDSLVKCCFMGITDARLAEELYSKLSSDDRKAAEDGMMSTIISSCFKNNFDNLSSLCGFEFLKDNKRVKEDLCYSILENGLLFEGDRTVESLSSLMFKCSGLIGSGDRVPTLGT